MHFAKEMYLAKDDLEQMKYEVVLPSDIDDCIANPNLKTSFEGNFEDELRHCLDRNLLREGFDKIEKCDATLFVNYPKNEIQGYMGASSLMELAIAFFLHKKIFLLYPVDRQQKYALEVELTKPLDLNGDINNIQKYLGV
ncbi:MAG: hypothetical protein WCK11_01055 [Candidatus Falkowbacteria bacterium]